MTDENLSSKEQTVSSSTDTSMNQGFRIEDYPIVSNFIPSDPILTVERDENGIPIRYCIDAHTEGVLQNQRVLQMISGIPIIYAAVMMDSKVAIWKRIGVGILGFGIMYTNYRSYFVVKHAEKRR